MTKAIEFNGEKLTKYLKQRGITKKGLSQEMGRTINYISLCTTNNKMSKSGYAFMCKWLGVGFDYFLDDKSGYKQLENQQSNEELCKCIIDLQKAIESLSNNVEMLNNQLQ